MKSSSRFHVSSSRLCHLTMVFFLILISSCNSGTQKTIPRDQAIESGAGKLVFSEEIHNFGALKAGEIVSFTFIFKNEGTKTLTITSVDAGCECTEVKIPDKIIEPGEEGQMEVIYNSAGEVGKQLKTITLFSDADEPEKKIYIKANITNELIEIYS